ncbi:MAG: hypothetical protein H6970_03590 [Gammaproteobacteria bacterium]|nr:hypothetical protein [Gammaproteobacteria bacterium]
MDPKEQAILGVQVYLDRNKARLQWMTVDFILWEARLFVPNLTLIPDSELRLIVAVWRSLNGPMYPMPVSPPQSPADSKIIEAAKKGLSTVIEGVDIKHGAGKINISVTGLTAELKKGDARLAAGVSWGGTLGLEAEAGDFHLTGELSSERWSVTLSYPEDTSIPDLTRLGKVFGEGESAMRKVIGATAGFRNLNDISRVKESIKPQLQPLKDAVEAVKGIAKAKTGPSFGITFGSPDPLPGETGIPRGIQGQAVLTWRF